jgi:prepilin-type processing-associated H-X9-DG protein
MPIQITCACGQTLEAGEELAGSRARCPACGRELTVPERPEGIQRGPANLPVLETYQEPAQDRLTTQPRPPVREGERTRRPEPWGYDEPSQPPQTSTKAVLSLVLGLLSLALSVITGIPAIILGILAQREIRQSRGGFTGSGMATAGIVVGALTSVLTGLVLLLLPAVQKVREAAARMQSQNNLKQIGLAWHNYHDNNNGLLEGGAIRDRNGTPLLSWRVALLPYVEQENLYRQFHLDEPWDSPHNKTLLTRMPKIYADPGAPSEDAAQGLTYYRAFTGPHSAFAPGENGRASIANITDGTSNTFMIVEAAEPIPWTKPGDLVYDPNRPLPKFASFFSRGFNAAFWDGSVRLIDPRDTDERTLRAMITAHGREIGKP